MGKLLVMEEPEAVPQSLEFCGTRCIRLVIMVIFSQFLLSSKTLLEKTDEERQRDAS